MSWFADYDTQTLSNQDFISIDFSYFQNYENPSSNFNWAEGYFERSLQKILVDFLDVFRNFFQDFLPLTELETLYNFSKNTLAFLQCERVYYLSFWSTDIKFVQNRLIASSLRYYKLLQSFHVNCLPNTIKSKDKTNTNMKKRGSITKEHQIHLELLFKHLKELQSLQSHISESLEEIIKVIKKSNFNVLNLTTIFFKKIYNYNKGFLIKNASYLKQENDNLFGEHIESQLTTKILKANQTQLEETPKPQYSSSLESSIRGEFFDESRKRRERSEVTEPIGRTTHTRKEEKNFREKYEMNQKIEKIDEIDEAKEKLNKKKLQKILNMANFEETCSKMISQNFEHLSTQYKPLNLQLNELLKNTINDLHQRRKDLDGLLKSDIVLDLPDKSMTSLSILPFESEKNTLSPKKPSFFSSFWRKREEDVKKKEGAKRKKKEEEGMRTVIMSKINIKDIIKIDGNTEFEEELKEEECEEKVDQRDLRDEELFGSIFEICSEFSLEEFKFRTFFGFLTSLMKDELLKKNSLYFQKEKNKKTIDALEFIKKLKEENDEKQEVDRGRIESEKRKRRKIFDDFGIYNI